LVYSTKPILSWDDMVVKSRGAWRGGYTEFTGFAAFHYKIVRFLGFSTKPRLKARQVETRFKHTRKL
jgi:hypothetical protein